MGRIHVVPELPEWPRDSAQAGIVRHRRATGSIRRVVVLAALAMPGDRERCLEAGADDCMSDPVKPGDLERVIKRLLGQRH